MYGYDLEQGGPMPVAAGQVYEQEMQLENLFEKLSENVKKMDKVTGTKQQALLKEMTAQMQEAKALIREFERDARDDNMPPDELNRRKKALVQELNGFIALKKAYSAQAAQRGELMQGASSSGGGGGLQMQELESMNNAELMTAGRKQLSEVDSSLFRSERVINDTIAIGAQTAETLQVQGGQLAKVMDDLDEIHFTMKKARQVLRDMARGLATDRCIMVMLLLVIIGIVVIVVLKILKVDGVKI